MEKALFILELVVVFLIIIFVITALLVFFIKLITMAFRRTKKLNIKKTFIILYVLLSVSFGIMCIYSIFFEKPTYWVDLGNNYQYMIDGSELDFSGYSGDGIFVYNNMKGVPISFPRVEKYQYNSNFITVKQKYNEKKSISLMMTILMSNELKWSWGGIDTTIFPVYDSLMYYDFSKYYEKGRNSRRVEYYADSVVSNNSYFTEMKKNKYNYYIIDKIQKHKIGPLSKTEFDSIFTHLNLPKELKLK